jgi:hypothetical protein
LTDQPFPGFVSFLFFLQYPPCFLEPFSRKHLRMWCKWTRKLSSRFNWCLSQCRWSLVPALGYIYFLQVRLPPKQISWHATRSQSISYLYMEASNIEVS